MNTLPVEKAETNEVSIRRVIAALDLTKKCEETLDYAAKLARRYHASLSISRRFVDQLFSLDKAVKIASEAPCPALVYREADPPWDCPSSELLS